MDYEQARDYINKIVSYGSVLGLDTITELLRRLGNPQNTLRFIHIGGTNGKGSTSAFLNSILVEAGYKVGRYVSPVVTCYEECIQISSKGAGRSFESKTEFIEKESVATYVSTIREFCNEMVKDGLPHPTTFEVETAMAMMAFVDAACDFVVLEVGLGGRMDATNVVETVECSVLTSISRDHMAFLGDTIEQIALEKAGIIKEGIPVVSYVQQQEAQEVIAAYCKEKKSALYCIEPEQVIHMHTSLEGTTFQYKYEEVDGVEEPFYIPLLGEHQVNNALVAIHTAFVLQKRGYRITEDHIRLGLANTKWPGRFSIISKEPFVIVDGAHNTDAAKQLSKALATYFNDTKGIFVMGVFADKEYEEIVRITVPFAKKVIAITPDNPRALPSEELVKVVRPYCEDVIDGKNITEGLRLAKECASEKDYILCYGSLSFLGEIMKK